MNKLKSGWWTTASVEADSERSETEALLMRAAKSLVKGSRVGNESHAWQRASE